MTSPRLKFALILLAVAAISMPAGAASVSSFGPLPGATFGGSGIPNDAVSITTITDNGVTITLGLAAHGRFDNPEVTNDGNGTFFARPGTRISPDDPSMLDAALWNFDFYVNIDGAAFDAYAFELLYDTDPGGGTDFGVLDLNNAATAIGADLTMTSLVEGSENLTFGFLFDDPVDFPFITPPGTPFDANATGVYSFALNATRISDSAFLGAATMDVSVVPLPPAVGIGVAGLGLVGFIRRRTDPNT